MENRRLVEDNARLMAEVRGGREELEKERERVRELYRDAESVRDELRKEIALFEKAKKSTTKSKKDP